MDDLSTTRVRGGGGMFIGRFIAAIALLAISGCGRDVNTGRVLNFAEIDSIGVSSRTISHSEIASVPHLVFAERPAGTIVLPSSASVAAAKTLTDGVTVVLTTEDDSLHVFDAAGRQLSAVGNVISPHGFLVGPGDSIITQYNGEVIWRDPHGVAVDTFSVIGEIVGVLGDGGLVVISNSQANGDDVFSVGILHFAVIGRESLGDAPTLWRTIERLVRQVIRGVQVDERAIEVFEGVVEVPDRLWATRWAKRTMVAPLGSSLWISPTGASSLVELTVGGKPIRRIVWEEVHVGSQEARSVWQDYLLDLLSAGRYPDDGDLGQEAEMIRTFEPGDRILNSIDRLFGGSDGTVWARRAAASPSAMTDQWMGFTDQGTLFGLLDVPRGLIPFELNRTYALVPSLDGLPGIQRFDLVVQEAP